MPLEGSSFVPAYDIASGFLTGVSTLIVGYLSSAATSIQAIRGTVYTEPGAAQQMRFVSTSTQDSAAGTGVRTLLITYYDGALTGPFTETVTMSGTTAVSTVATNIQFVESIIAQTVGSNGTNVGTISLQNIGGGTTFGSIAVGDGRTHWCHHYIAAGRTGFIRGFNAGTTGVSGSVFLRAARPLTANAFEQQITTQYRITTGANTLPAAYEDLWITGPARITAYTKPDALTAGTIFADLDIYEL